MLDEMLDMLVGCCIHVRRLFAQQSNMSPTYIPNIDKNIFFVFICVSMMAEYQFAELVVISELIDSDDEKETRGKTRNWMKRRESHGYYNNIVQELLMEDPVGFRDMFRMTYSDFQNILQYIEKEITPQDAVFGTRCILGPERLALTLRYLATGETFQSLELQFRISVRAISYIVKGVCDAIVKFMVPIYIKVPNSVDEWLEIAQKFKDRWNFPHALGAIDGKHIVIQKRKNGGSYFYNYKHTHSVILIAIAGPDYECLYADVGTNGRVNDGGVWNKSVMFGAIENGTVQFPDDGYLHSNTVKAPYVLLGDDAFALKRYMMKPYPQQNLTLDKRIYNYRHSRARRISENLFGILANRWRVYHTKILVHPDRMNSLILTTSALHNMLRKSPGSRNLYNHQYIGRLT